MNLIRLTNRDVIDGIAVNWQHADRWAQDFENHIDICGQRRSILKIRPESLCHYDAHAMCPNTVALHVDAAFDDDALECWFDDFVLVDDAMVTLSKMCRPHQLHRAHSSFSSYWSLEAEHLHLMHCWLGLLLVLDLHWCYWHIANTVATTNFQWIFGIHGESIDLNETFK